MPRSIESAREKSNSVDLEQPKNAGGLTGTDEDFGGHEARVKLERKLLRKLDLRMSILVVIYILNYVRTFLCHRNKL
jgi:hypothetical protein